MSDNKLDLVYKARKLLSLNNRELAEYLGWSLRTIQRHTQEGGIAYSGDYHKLIRGVHPKDRALAADLAAAVGTNLVALGLEVETPRAPPPPPAPPTRPEHADAVVYAAADALGLPPRQVRPAVIAVFARARELGVNLDGLAKLLAAEQAENQRSA